VRGEGCVCVEGEQVQCLGVCCTSRPLLRYACAEHSASHELRCRGINDFCQLGNGGTDYATHPVPVVGLEDVVISDMAAGGWHSMAISTLGEVFVWGRGEYGRLGLGDKTGSSKPRPQKVGRISVRDVRQALADFMQDHDFMPI
jgi:hypothetical protein